MPSKVRILDPPRSTNGPRPAPTGLRADLRYVRRCPTVYGCLRLFAPYTRPSTPGWCGGVAEVAMARCCVAIVDDLRAASCVASRWCSPTTRHPGGCALGATGAALA